MSPAQDEEVILKLGSVPWSSAVISLESHRQKSAETTMSVLIESSLVPPSCRYLMSRRRRSRWYQRIVVRVKDLLTHKSFKRAATGVVA